KAAWFTSNTLAEEDVFLVHVDKGYPDSTFFVQLAETFNDEHQSNASVSFKIIVSHNSDNIIRSETKMILHIVGEHFGYIECSVVLLRNFNGVFCFNLVNCLCYIELILLVDKKFIPCFDHVLHIRSRTQPFTITNELSRSKVEPKPGNL